MNKKEWAQSIITQLEKFDFKLDDADKNDALADMMIECLDKIDDQNESDDIEVDDRYETGLIRKWDMDKNQKLFVEFFINALTILEGDDYEQFKISMTDLSKDPALRGADA